MPLPELLALVALGPLMALAIWWDLRSMRLPNWLTGATALLFVPYAVAFLGWEEAGWRLVGGALVLVIGYALFFAGRMGGGDAKLLAACALFVPARDIMPALYLLCFWLAVGLALLLLARAVVRRFAPPDLPERWMSLAPKGNFPMGISIGAAMLSYLALRVLLAQPVA